MVESSSPDKYTKTLLDGHLHAAYVLPSDVVEAWQAANRAHAMQPSKDAPPAEHLVWSQLVADGVAAFHSGGRMPDAAAVLAARRTAEAAFLQGEKLRREVT